MLKHNLREEIKERLGLGIHILKKKSSFLDIWKLFNYIVTYFLYDFLSSSYLFTSVYRTIILILLA